jgi:probable HAF family extracellular repeat protein
MSAGSLDDIPDKLMAAKGGKPGKPPDGNGEKSDYMVTDLGTLDGKKRSSSVARDISDINDITGNRLIVGWSDDGQQTVATLWEVTEDGDVVEGSMQSLGTLDGQTSSEANAINQAGTMAAGHAGTQEYPIPVYWDLNTGLISELYPLDDFSYGVAYDVNNDGKIAGVSTGVEDERTVYYATLWNENHIATQLESPDTNEPSRALGINNDGDVVGMSWVWEDGSYLPHAVLWRYIDEGYEVCDLHKLDSDDYKISGAHAITDRENGIVKITGMRDSWVTVWEMDLSSGCVYVGLQDLGLSAYAWDNNADGVAVGQDHSTGSVRPVLWRPAENEMVEMVVLPSLTGDNGSAEGINYDGQIVGWSKTGAKKHAALWTKKDQTQ